MHRLGRLSAFKIKRTLFRRAAELSFYSEKPFRLPNIGEIKNTTEFKDSFPFNFMSSLNEQTEIRQLLLEIENKEVIISESESAFDNIFSFPSAGSISLGSEIKWNYDYTSGYQWENLLCWRHDYYNYPSGTDIVNPWLLGRLNQLISLGKGYLATGDEKYTERYKLLLQQFIDQNPFCASLNWLDAGEVSIRLLNIIFSLPFFIWSEKVDHAFISTIREYIILHSAFIENNFPWEEGYECLISFAALAASGVILKNSRYGERLLHLSHSGAEEFVRKQFSREGISKVRSILFIPHIIEALIIIKLSFDKIPVKLSRSFLDVYSKSFDVLAAMIREDGSIAASGDEFVRRIIPFSGNAGLRHSFPLALGCAELKKGSFKYFVSSPTSDILFYRGRNAVTGYNTITKSNYRKITYGYTQSGIFILKNDDLHITIDASEIGSGFSKTRGHNDTLSFELFYREHPIVIDPGTYSFYDTAVRNKLRSVKSHNTVYIDDEEPVELAGFFSIKEDLTKPKITWWHSDEQEDTLSVQHYAYSRFSDPVIIKRIFRLLKEKNKLVIRDELFGGSSHQVFANLVFDPRIDPERTDECGFRFSYPVNGEVIFSAPSDKLVCSIMDNLYSPSYGRLTHTKKITAVLSAQLPVYITTEILIK